MSCAEHVALLSHRAAGALGPEEEARLAAHLAGCDACRAEAARLDDLFTLLRPAEASAVEERGAAFLPARTRAAARAAEPSSGRLGWVAVGAAAGLALSLGVGLGLRTVRSRPPQGEVVAAAAAPAGWQEPDPEELWEWSGSLASDVEESP